MLSRLPRSCLGAASLANRQESNLQQSLTGMRNIKKSPRFQQQTRTVILKRSHDPPLVKREVIAGGAMVLPVTQDRIDRSVPDDILYRRYIECEEETEADETVPPIQIILTKSIEEFGRRGQVLTMASEKAHKELLYHGLAVYASPDNLKKYEDIIIPEDAVQFSSKSVQMCYAELSRLPLCLVMHDLNPWTLEKWHVRLALRHRGVHVSDEDSISINAKPLSGPNPKFQGREVCVRLKVNGLEDLRLRLVIFQKSEKELLDEDEDIPLEDILSKEEIPPPGWEWMFNQPIFEDEAEELAEIPRQHMTEDIIKDNPALKPHFEKYKQWRTTRDQVLSK